MAPFAQHFNSETKSLGLVNTGVQVYWNILKHWKNILKQDNGKIHLFCYQENYMDVSKPLWHAQPREMSPTEKNNNNICERKLTNGLSQYQLNHLPHSKIRWPGLIHCVSSRSMISSDVTTHKRWPTWWKQGSKFYPENSGQREKARNALTFPQASMKKNNQQLFSATVIFISKKI